MERMIHFEQFYYTNYGQGMRFEGNSTGQTGVAAALELLASNWMRQDQPVPVEMVFYNRRLDTYIAAMSRPCTEIGDARTSYWIHAVMPVESGSDGFMDCLAWPLKDYQTEVRLGESLKQVTIAAPTVDLTSICRKYHLTGNRLQTLMYRVWKTVCDASASSCLCLTTGERLTDDNASARAVMAVIYHLLPKPYRKELDYLAKSNSDREDVRFYFKEKTTKKWHFPIGEINTEAPDLALPEEEAYFLAQMAALYEQSPEGYAQMLDKICQSSADDYETMLWNYYKCCLQEGMELPFSQETLVRIQSFLEEKLKLDEGYRLLFCQCLNQIAITNQPVFFIQSLMEQSIVAAAELSGKKEWVYVQSLSHNWQLMDQLSKGEKKVIVAYLQWLKEISRVYYQDFIQCGLLEGRDWLLDLQLTHNDTLSYQELMGMDLTWMNVKRGRLWVDAMTGCLKRHLELQHSQKTAKEVWQYLIEMLGELASEAIGEADIFMTPEAAEQIRYLMIFIWQNRAGFDIEDKSEICGAAKVYCGHLYETFSETFWEEVRAEDFAVLYDKGSMVQLFGSSTYPNYQNYRYYVGYRHKEERPDKRVLTHKEKEALQMHKHTVGETVTVLTEAIWIFWRTHPNAKNEIFSEYITILMSENELSERLNQYSAEGAEQFKRAEQVRKMITVQPQPQKQSDERADEQLFEMDVLSVVIGFMAGFVIALLLVWLIPMMT